MWTLRLKRWLSKKPSHRLWRDMSQQQEVLALRTHFKELMKVLKEKRLDKLPWYLVLGLEKSGKTTLLSQKFHHWLLTIPAFFAVRTQDTTAQTPWTHPICVRVSQDAVFIEIPGRYLQAKTDKHSVFAVFLSLLKQYKIAPLLRGILVTLSLSEVALWSVEKQSAPLALLKHSLLQISQAIKHPIPVQILLSQLDSVLGFNEFFVESLKEESTDLFGIEFSAQFMGRMMPASQAFAEQFDQLLNKLNERVIGLLHRERLIDKKARIADFPQQLASLKTVLQHVIYDLFDVTAYQHKLLLSGIYFCSHTHHGDAVDHLGHLLHRYPLKPREPEVTTLKPKSYFVAKLVKKISQFSMPSELPAKPWFAIPRTISVTVLILLTVIPLLYLGIDFQQKSAAISRLQHEWNRQSVNSRLNPTLAQQVIWLNTLQTMLVMQRSLPFSGLVRFNWHPLHQLAIQTQESYRVLLQDQLIPGIRDRLTRDLLNASVTNTRYLYSDLKAYLALAAPTGQASYLTAWLKQYLVRQNALPTPFIPIDVRTWSAVALDNPAILHAQAVLNHLPKPLLAYLILQGNNPPVAINPFPVRFEDVFVYPALMRDIPVIYTHSQFESVYFEGIPNAVRAAFVGNDVLGKPFFTQVSGRDVDSVVEQVRAFYLQDYASRWQRILTRTEIKLANTLAETLAILHSLNQIPSPIVSLLQTVAKQTTFDLSELSQHQPPSARTQLYQQMKIYFNWDSHVNDWLKTNPQVMDETARLELHKISQHLSAIVKAQNNYQAAFEAVKAEYKHPVLFAALAKMAFTMPQPLSRWFISLISNDWFILLQSANNYTNQLWKKQVVTEYQTKLNGRYPFTKSSALDVELADFAHFFAVGGTLDAFFNQYFLPFIDDHSSRWQWQELYGRTFSQNSDLPLQLERAALIRKMFFAKSGELAVEFYLSPIALAPQLKSVQISIDGQILNTQTPNLIQTPLIWPGMKGTDGTQLILLKQNGEQILLTEKGAWSLFRLLDNACLQPMQDSKHYTVLFDRLVKYQLIAENALNPFIPNFISQFSCPDLS